MIHSDHSSSPSSRSFSSFTLQLVFASAGLALIGGLSSFYPVKASIILNIVFPLAVMVSVGMVTRFGYIKLGTLVLGRVLIVLAALGFGEAHIGWICLLLLQLNILEATILDTVNRNVWNAFNGLILLASSLFMSIGFSGAYVFIAEQSWLLWIIAYTVWNALFVLKNLPAHQFAAHFVILLAPLLFCLVAADSAYWLVLRETTLCFAITVIACIRDRFEPYVYSVVPESRLVHVSNLIYRHPTQLAISMVIAVMVAVQCSLLPW